MGYTLKKYLAKNFKLSNTSILDALQNKQLMVNEKEPSLNQLITEFDSIHFFDKTLQHGKDRIYLAYYKPRGIESTLNKNINNNLADAIGFEEKLFPVGRLDKESEGLMLLTNDGQIYNQLAHSKSQIEKEYQVETDKIIIKDDLCKLESGIEIMGQITKPCSIEILDDTHFTIILKQGLNRQIRRMCYKLGYNVLSLIRIRIASVKLENLTPGQYRFLTKEDILI